MSESTKRALEVLFFIIATLALIKPPAELIAITAANGTAAVFTLAATIFIFICAWMVFVCVLRLIKHGRFWVNLIAAIIYFVNILAWIEVI
jgi:hypothetical protein